MNGTRENLQRTADTHRIGERQQECKRAIALNCVGNSPYMVVLGSLD